MPDNNKPQPREEWTKARKKIMYPFGGFAICIAATFLIMNTNATILALPFLLAGIVCLVIYYAKRKKLKYIQKYNDDDFSYTLKDGTQLEVGQHIDDGEMMYEVTWIGNGYFHVVPIAAYMKKYGKWTALPEVFSKFAANLITNTPKTNIKDSKISIAQRRIGKYNLNTEYIYTGYELKHGKQEAKETSFETNPDGYYYANKEENNV